MVEIALGGHGKAILQLAGFSSGIGHQDMPDPIAGRPAAVCRHSCRKGVRIKHHDIGRHGFGTIAFFEFQPGSSGEVVSANPDLDIPACLYGVRFDRAHERLVSGFFPDQHHDQHNQGSDTDKETNEYRDVGVLSNLQHLVVA